MPSDLVWLLKERAVTHLRVFHWFSSKPGARCELLAEVITLNQKKTISGFGSTPWLEMPSVAPHNSAMT